VPTLTEKHKMLAGELYDPNDAELVALRRHARLLVKAYNETSDDQQQERARLLLELIRPQARGS
jgi:maltose O-acetyltransferase